MTKSYPYLSKVLKKLLFDKQMKPIDLSREIDIPQPTIHRLITGKSTRPYQSSLQPIADYFSISIEQLVGVESLDSNATALQKNNIKSIPLYPWKSILLNKNEKLSQEREIAVTNQMSDNAFALIMPDSSMEPLFLRQSILIFDPAVTPKDRNYVLVKLHSTQKYIFRQLLIDGDHRYIKLLNPDLQTANLILLSNEDLVVACLIESRTNYFHTNMDYNPEEYIQ